MRARTTRSLFFALALAAPVGAAGLVSAAALQTQPFLNHDAEADLIKASARDGILTVAVRYRNLGGSWFKLEYELEDVHFIDTGAGKKVHLLRDDKGAFLASHLSGHRQVVEIHGGQSSIVWFKFPAPHSPTARLDIAVPVALPFENVAVGGP